MSRPIVTALIDTYNHERYIEQALASVLGQDVPPDELEILVVDDGSTDATPEILKRFEPRVRLLRKTNGGQASAFNAAIREARGEVVAFLDADDWWAPGKLRAVLEAFESDSALGVAGHGFIEVDSEKGRQSAICPEEGRRFDFHTLEGALPFRFWRCFFGTSRVAIRRSVLKRVLPIPEAMVIEADEYMSTLSIALSNAKLLEEPLTYYRLHAANLYQFQGNDAVKLRRKYAAIAALLQELPPRLLAAQIPSEIVEALMEPVRVEVERMRLVLDGGTPWNTFCVERAAFRLDYKEASAGYHLFKRLVLGMTLLLPPQRFYRLRDWYSAKNLRRYRGFLGEPVPAAPIVQQRHGIEAGR